MIIELKQDKAIETYVTKERQYIDNLHIYLFIIKEGQKKESVLKIQKRCLLFDLSTNKFNK